MAATRFDNRRQMVVEEANAIGTCYLRASLLPQEARGELRALLRQNADARLEALDPARRADAVRRSEELHEPMWQQLEPSARNTSSSIIVGLFVQALNEVIDVHSKRLLVAVQPVVCQPWCC